MKKDCWIDVVGYEGLYEVSHTGFVRSLISERVLIQRADKYGYLKVNLHKDGKMKTMKMHRLVAQAFIENPENKPTVEHMDGNKKNNHVDNLIWATLSEQQQTAPCKGYCWNKEKGKWQAQIRIPGDKQLKFIGRFDNEEDAHAAYIAEKYKQHPFWVEVQERLDNRPPLIKVEFKLKNQ